MSATGIRYLIIVSIILALAGLSSTVSADNGGDRAASEEKARNYFTNLELINQNGEKVLFYDDVLKDKVVVINFIFTNCQGACPLMTRNLTMVRDMLGESAGRKIHFVTLSLDPERDTPQAMKEFAETHNANQDGWQFLTGVPDNVNFIVNRLGSFTEDLEAHSTTLLAANVRNAHWTKIPPTVPPQGVVQRLTALIEEDTAM